MDEFHSFTDPERSVVWELSLGLLAPHIRTLLALGDRGQRMEFVHWLRNSHQRQVENLRTRPAYGLSHSAAAAAVRGTNNGPLTIQCSDARAEHDQVEKLLQRAYRGKEKSWRVGHW